MRHTANLERVEQRVASSPAVVLVWQGLAVSLASSTFLSTTKALDLLQAQENLLAANDQVWETARKWSVACLLTNVAGPSVPIPVIRTNVNSFCRLFNVFNVLMRQLQLQTAFYRNIFQIYNNDQTSSKVVCACAKSLEFCFASFLIAGADVSFSAMLNSDKMYLQQILTESVHICIVLGPLEY